MRLIASLACAFFASGCNLYACDIESLDVFLSAVIVPAAADSQIIVARGSAPSGPEFGTVDHRIRAAFTERDGDPWAVNVWLFASWNGEHVRVGLRITTPLRVGQRIEIQGVPDTVGVDPVYGLPWNVVMNGEEHGRFGLWIGNDLSSESVGTVEVTALDPLRMVLDVTTVLRGQVIRLHGTLEFVHIAYTANCS